MGGTKFSMNDADATPKLDFFRAIPENLMAKPPLCSSLQSLESSFFLVALDRFPHALVTCGSGIESAMKSLLGINPEKFVNADKLYKMAADRCPVISEAV